MRTVRMTTKEMSRALTAAGRAADTRRAAQAGYESAVRDAAATGATLAAIGGAVGMSAEAVRQVLVRLAREDAVS